MRHVNSTSSHLVIRKLKAPHQHVLEVDELIASIADDEQQGRTGGMLALTNGPSPTSSSASPPPKQETNQLAVWTPERNLLTTDLSVFARARALCKSPHQADSDNESVESVVRQPESYGLENRPRQTVMTRKNTMSLEDALGMMRDNLSVQHSSSRNEKRCDRNTRDEISATSSKRIRTMKSQPVHPAPQSSADKSTKPKELAESLALVAALAADPCPAGVGAQTRHAVKNGAPQKRKHEVKLKSKTATHSKHSTAHSTTDANKSKSKTKHNVKAKPAAAVTRCAQRNAAKHDTTAEPLPQDSATTTADKAAMRLRVLAGLKALLPRYGKQNQADATAPASSESTTDGDMSGDVPVARLIARDEINDGPDSAVERPTRRVRGKTSGIIQVPAGDISTVTHFGDIAMKAVDAVVLPTCSKDKDCDGVTSCRINYRLRCILKSL